MRTPVQPVHSSLVGCEAFGKCLIAVVLTIPARGIGSSEQQHDHARDDYLPRGDPAISCSFAFLLFFSAQFRHHTFLYHAFSRAYRRSSDITHFYTMLSRGLSGGSICRARPGVPSVGWSTVTALRAIRQ